MTISVSVPYTCGELFQGTLDGQPCLVSCPITIYSAAQIGSDEIRQSLPDKVRRALDKLPLASNASLPPISLMQRLPSGRGYGTSTADIGAVIFAMARYAELSITPLEAARLAVSIEPTDSAFFPGLTLFDHRYAEFHQTLGSAPSAAVVILDPGGAVNSEDFNARDWKPALEKLTSQHRQAFDLLQGGIAAQDLSAIGEAATLSAKAHQSILFNPLLEQALALARETGAIGICRAHSGTILGLLFPKPSFDKGTIIPYLRKKLPAQIHLRVTELTGGGSV
jgi:L-threonine kinase